MTLFGASVARMLNTCSIGRRWKSREGWSRPVLTGERGTLFPIPLLGWGLGLVLWWFSRWMARNAVSCGHDDTGKAFIARVRCPVPGPPRPESVVWLVPLPADPGWGLAVHSGFAVVMAQVRRPVPFRTRKLRPGTAMVLHSRGCGRVARRRIQRWTFWSSPLGDSRKVPFVFPLGVPAGRNAPETPPFCFVSPARRPEPIAPGVPVGPFPLLGVRIIPRAGRSRTPRDFRNFRGASCAYPMVE